MNRGLTLTVLVAALTVPAFGQSANGIVITQRVTSAGAPMTVRMHMDGTRTRTEMSGPNGVTNVTIFDGGKQVLYTIDPARKTYSETTKADVERMGAQLRGAMAQMQAQLEKLPPAQRAQMNAMMKGVEQTRTGSDQVGGWTCEKYDLTLAGQRIGETCNVSLTTLGFVPADFDVMRQMGTFYSSMGPQTAGQFPGLSSIDPRGGSDFPVRTLMVAPGGHVTTEVIEAVRQTFSDSLFAVPDGFTKLDLPAAFGGGGAGAPR
jgi:hypothetical protein